jgi:hypothetical protein
MRIDSVTKYRCDGCHTEASNPCGWYQFIPLLSGTWTTAVAGNIPSSNKDYCNDCANKMRKACRPEAKL